jgi:hypothetical protein
MQHSRSRLRRRSWIALIATASLAAAAGTAYAATSQSSRPATGDPGKVAALQQRLAAVRKQNAALQAFSPKGMARRLARAKAALDKYASVDQAKADGYAMASPCEQTVTNPGASSDSGAMGIHFVNQALMKPGPFVPSKPPILVYAPTQGGGLRLVAAEYFKPDADQNVKTDDDRPSLFGRAFDGPMLGHSPGMPIHYDLHVWLWKHNPSGMFAPWNPDVSCTG